MQLETARYACSRLAYRSDIVVGQYEWPDGKIRHYRSHGDTDVSCNICYCWKYDLIHYKRLG